ncbi:MAG: type II toxin-antitoxin system YafQ family toxin [Planctomycetaceae bacterium]|jgi:mRNA interferase YafQ|nr:type II toxin-antitoxin system YafQ family toxin [Planctomycetaceae bacterium]
MLKIVFSNKMKRDIKRVAKRGRDLAKLEFVLDTLANRIPLPQKYKDHQLIGNLNDFRECHVEPDWLLIYQISEDNLTLFATRTGTHADLFE